MTCIHSLCLVIVRYQHALPATRRWRLDSVSQGRVTYVSSVHGATAPDLRVWVLVCMCVCMYVSIALVFFSQIAHWWQWTHLYHIILLPERKEARPSSTTDRSCWWARKTRTATRNWSCWGTGKFVCIFFSLGFACSTCCFGRERIRYANDQSSFMHSVHKSNLLFHSHLQGIHSLLYSLVTLCVHTCNVYKESGGRILSMASWGDVVLLTWWCSGRLHSYSLAPPWAWQEHASTGTCKYTLNCNSIQLDA